MFTGVIRLELRHLRRQPFPGWRNDKLASTLETCAPVCCRLSHNLANAATTTTSVSQPGSRGSVVRTGLCAVRYLESNCRKACTPNTQFPCRTDIHIRALQCCINPTFTNHTHQIHTWYKYVSYKRSAPARRHGCELPRRAAIPQRRKRRISDALQGLTSLRPHTGRVGEHDTP